MPRATPTPRDERHATNLAWLIRLRWVALATQGALVVAARTLLHAHVPLDEIALLGVAVAISNAILSAWQRRAPRVGERVLAAILAFDLVVLTGLLVLSGGPFNPFSALYLVQVALAPVVLGARLSWAIVALAIALFGLLFLRPAWLPMESVVDHATQMRIHLQGMWVAFAVSAIFVGYFVRKVRIAMDARDAELAEARARAARDEKLAALATLSAGAAHELATPLSTIAVAAKELERRLGRAAADDPAREEEREDAALIREQVERCRTVLEQMSADAGGSLGEVATDVNGGALAEEIATDGHGATLRVDPSAREVEVHLPRRATVRALRGLVKNAREAAGEAEVAIEARALRGALTLVVRDAGPGIDGEDLARIGEPFFTTKEPGAGMGLGVFLARAVVERSGGTFTIRSTKGEGTRVEVTLPCAPCASPASRVGVATMSTSERRA